MNQFGIFLWGQRCHILQADRLSFVFFSFSVKRKGLENNQIVFDVNVSYQFLLSIKDL